MANVQNYNRSPLLLIKAKDATITGIVTSYYHQSTMQNRTVATETSTMNPERKTCITINQSINQ